MTDVVLRVRGVHTRRGDTDILRGVDLEVERGEVLAVVGPSGSGKTTLLRALNYLTPFDAGEVEVAGRLLRPGMCERADAAALREVRLRVGMVFQSFHLFPAPDRDRQRRGGAAPGARPVARAGTGAGEDAARVGSDWRTARRPCRTRSREASSSASRSRARSPWSRWRCCSTSPPPRSTRG